MTAEVQPYDGLREGAVCAECDPYQEPSGPNVAMWKVDEWDVDGNFVGAWPACDEHVPKDAVEW